MKQMADDTTMQAVLRGACAGLRDLGLEVKEVENGAVLVRVPQVEGEV